MARLRVRMELNRGGVGVPLVKLAHVVDEAQKFFRMLGEDVHIDRNTGEWLGYDFDNQALNFTAEYVGAVSADQVREFHAAFDGVTQLRRATIAQFARIADPIGEDELIGFGLFQNDREQEPSEWRSLSKREALRISEEIRMLLDRAEGYDQPSRIPAVLDPNAAASVFKGRDHGVSDRRIEGLAQRVERLETEVTDHSNAIQNLRGASANTEQNLQKLLVTVDAFCDRAARQIEKLPPAEAAEAEKTTLSWRVPAIVAGVLIAGFLVFQLATTPREPSVQASQPPAVAPAPKVETPAPPQPPEAPAPQPSVRTGMQRVEVKAIEPTWIGVYVDDQPTFANVLAADQTKTIESAGNIRLRVGNAGGVEVVVNGKLIGPLGRNGQVRIIDFADGEFKFVPLPSAKK